MKNIFSVTVLSLISILLVTSCSKIPQTPADTIVKPSAEILQKQKNFDQAMIRANKQKNDIKK